MNNLNVFKNYWSPWKYPSNWIRNARVFFRQFKWAYQRVTRGFCDYDYWDLDTYLSELMAQSIKMLADNTHGYPGTEEFPTYESWKEYLYKIVNLLRYSLNEDMPNEYEEAWTATWKDKDILDALNNKTPEEKEISNKYFDKEYENECLKRKAQDQALDMIKHVYNNLWD